MTVYVESDHVPQVGCSTQRVNHRMVGMGEENPNLEARNSKQILNSNIPMFKTPHWFSFIATVKVCFGHLNVRFWLLFRISDLEFRIYPLISQKNPSHTPCIQQSPLWGNISLTRRRPQHAPFQKREHTGGFSTWVYVDKKKNYLKLMPVG